jgi:hypothetical protein
MVTEQNKDDFLEEMYRKSGGQKAVHLGELKIQFEHWDKDTFWDTAQALEDDKLIVYRGHGYAHFTPEGRRRAEKRIHPTPTFTQNTVTIGTAINSPIQQSGAHANMTQTVSYSHENLDDLHRLVEVFDAHLDDLNLDAPAKQKAMVQVATIKAQLQGEPDSVIVKQAGRTLWDITKGVISSLIATAVQPTVWGTAAAIMAKLFGGS